MSKNYHIAVLPGDGINRPGPALIHVRIDAEQKVYPMVPPGAANTEMVGE